MGEIKVEENFVSSSLQNLHLTEENIRNQLTHDDYDHKQWKRLVEDLEKIAAYKFKNPDLLHEAFTHSSFQEKGASFGRLESIGDSVLNVLIARQHYFDYPDLPPGKLTTLRATNIVTEKLARVAIKYNLHNYLHHKMPLLIEQVEEFREATLDYPLHSAGLIDPPKVLANIVKSLVGAISIDSKCIMDITWQVVKDLLQPLVTLEKLEVHPATKIHELCQKNGLRIEIIGQWEKTGEVEIFVDGKFVGKGKSRGKKTTAVNRAAHNAEKNLVRLYTPTSQNLHLTEENIRNQLTLDDDDHKQWRRLVEELEEITAYKFKNPDLLYQAFTHSSFQTNCASYERMEYIGDSVLSMLIAKQHYFDYPDLPPRTLTRLKAANVDTEKLARVAIKYNLHGFLRHKKPLFEGQVKEFRKATLEYPLHSAGLIDSPKILADIIEALIDSICIDSNFSMDTTWQVVKHMLQPLVTPDTLVLHPVTKIKELCQKNGLKIAFIGQWEKTKEIEVFVDEKFVGRGKSSRKRTIAQNKAAHNAYYQVVKILSLKAAIDDRSIL